MANAYCIGWDKTLPNYDPLYYSASHEFDRSKYVVRAKVIRETWLGEDGKPKPLQPPFQFGNPRPWGFDPYIGAYYDIEVETSFKGHPPEQLRLFSENSTARFWLKTHDDYLLFIGEEKFEDPIGTQLTIDTCGKSSLLVKAGGSLKIVEKLSRKN